MKFIKNGPDIPERLLQSHEDGKVVFFCGAGISYPAKLPSFRGLVDRIYSELGAYQDEIEKQAYAKEQFDTTLELLEHRIPGQRIAVRTALAKVLKPNLRLKGATATHEALIRLGTDRNGKVRLVTTNFDRIFQRFLKSGKSTIPSFPAPLLPVPKDSRWNGLVYLHGILPDNDDESALNRLVLTSGDFGLAYLTERWAARFVSELFRNYIVCFVGYSINDPVLRYMMDALAADRMLGESTQDAYAFGSFETGESDSAMVEWRAKSVIPLLYEVPARTNDHSLLHSTLKEWAATYRDGVRGKESIITRESLNPPLVKSRLDFSVGQILWALADKTGLPAKLFADSNPVPPFEWIEPLSENQYDFEHLPLFGIPTNRQKDDKLTFSLARRPAPYTHAPWMLLVGPSSYGSNCDEPMYQLARWLTRHLDNPKLILWIVKHGGHLNNTLAALIVRKIAELDELAEKGKNAELVQIKTNAPDAVPRPGMRTLWRFILSGRTISIAHDASLLRWFSHLKQVRLTQTMRMELRQLLTPRVSLREPYRLKELNEQTGSGLIRELVDWEIELSSHHVHSALHTSATSENWRAALPQLLQDFSALLLDALNLMNELGGADSKSDHSYMHQPSISPHSQNQKFHDWTALIDLTSSAWIAAVEVSPRQALLMAENWLQTPYPLFKRLAFFAATTEAVVAPSRALEWLLTEEHWWLWSVETQREAIRLMVTIAPKLTPDSMVILERAILVGPPREMFRTEIDPEQWERAVDHEVWVRLSKLTSSGISLSAESNAQLNAISQRHPQWQIGPNERDEFPFWMESGWGGESSLWRKFVVTPRRRRDLVAFLRNPHAADSFQEDDWRQRCRDEFPTAACALLALSLENTWPTERWREALQAWAEDKLLRRSWRRVAPILLNAPNLAMETFAQGLSWWLRAQAKTFEGHEERFLLLIERVLELNHQDGAVTDEPVTRAINHPIGQVTEGLLDWWYRGALEDNQGLPEKFKGIVTRVCNTRIEQYRHGRVLLAAHVIALFRVDPIWATQNLLPCFDWNLSEDEARSAWEGFLWSPRLYRPLIEAIKKPFLATALHYDKLGHHAEQYAAVLTFAALELGDTFTVSELASATQSLPLNGLRRAAFALVNAMEGAGDQRAEYWTNRVQRYLKLIWPKNQVIDTAAIAESFALLCIAANTVFPKALEQLKHWLRPSDQPANLYYRLREARLSTKFPIDALFFLDLVTGQDAQWLPVEFKECLDEIEQATQTLTNDTRFRRLRDLARKYGYD